MGREFKRVSEHYGSLKVIQSFGKGGLGVIRKREKRDTGARDKVTKKCVYVYMYKENGGCEKGRERKTGMVSFPWWKHSCSSEMLRHL